MDIKEQKKLNKQKIKQYKRQLRSETFDVDKEVKFNSEGAAIIECKIGNAKDMFSPYDILKDRTIDDEFDKYLMEETAIIPLRYNLEVKIHVNEDCTSETQNQIKSAIRRYYSFEITKSKVNLKKNRFFSFILYFIGILSLLATPFASKLSNIPVYELLLLVIWFTLWEASNISIFQCSQLKANQINMVRIYNADITFIKDPQIMPKTTVIADRATIITDKSTVYAGKSNTKEQTAKSNTNAKKEIENVKNLTDTKLNSFKK